MKPALLLAALTGCTAAPERARATWVGDSVAEYRKSLPVLDDLPSYTCPGPPDDAIVFRAMDHVARFSFSVSESTGYVVATSFGYYRSTILPFNTYERSVRSPYDAHLELWYSSYIYTDPAEQFQGERRYDMGLAWPTNPYYSDLYLVHTLSGEADRYENVNVMNPQSWDSTSWDPEVYFYPVADCTSHLRPNRFAGWYWMDPGQAGMYRETNPYPIWMVWNSGAAYVNDVQDLEFGYASTSETAGFRQGPNNFNAYVYDGLALADVWPHLAKPSKGDE